MPHPERGGGPRPESASCHLPSGYTWPGVLHPQGFEGQQRRRTTYRHHKLPEVLLVVSMREGVPPQGADVFGLRWYG